MIRRVLLLLAVFLGLAAPLPAAFRDFLVASSARFPALAVELRELSGIDIEYAPGIGLIFVAYDEAEWAFVQRVALTLPAGTSLEMLSAAEAIRLEPRLTPELLFAHYDAPAGRPKTMSSP